LETGAGDKNSGESDRCVVTWEDSDWLLTDIVNKFANVTIKK